MFGSAETVIADVSPSSSLSLSLLSARPERQHDASAASTTQHPDRTGKALAPRRAVRNRFSSAAGLILAIPAPIGAEAIPEEGPSSSGQNPHRPGTNLPAQAQDSCNDEDMPMICPTAQEVFSERGSRRCKARPRGTPPRSYSITSSASAASVGGISSPIDFAVLRLITNWKRVGCSTGRSAGLAPFRMRSTIAAARSKDSCGSAP